jgi:MbtH protein
VEITACVKNFSGKWILTSSIDKLQSNQGGNGMNREDQEDTTIYKVVLNHEEQYSIWPAERENALGWRDAGKSGTKEECLSYIKEVWTDLRPLSLRKQMEKAAGKAS